MTLWRFVVQPPSQDEPVIYELRAPSEGQAIERLRQHATEGVDDPDTSLDPAWPLVAVERRPTGG